MNMSGQNVSLHPAAAQQLHQIQRTQRFLQEKSTSSLVNQHSIKHEASQESSVSVPNRQKEASVNLPHGRQMSAAQSCLSEELDRTAMNTSIRTHDKTLLSSLTRKELISNGNQNSKSNLMTNGSATMTSTTTPTSVVQMPVRSRTEPSPEEMTDLEELEQFAKMFKQRRIKLG